MRNEIPSAIKERGFGKILFMAMSESLKAEG